VRGLIDRIRRAWRLDISSTTLGRRRVLDWWWKEMKFWKISLENGSR